MEECESLGSQESCVMGKPAALVDILSIKTKYLPTQATLGTIAA